MERLTKRLPDGKAVMDCDSCEQKKDKQCTFYECRASLIKRLAAYEDTGLTPEAVETVKIALAAKHLVDLETLNNTPISRLVELAEADKDGRCVVLPCKVGDTAYYLNRPVILDFEVIGYMVDERGAWSFMGEHLDKTTGDTYSCCPDTEKVGKTVFLTREEAERALQEMEGKKDGV